MAKKRKLDAQGNWEPSEMDPLNISALRMYVLKIESLSLAIYRSDLPAGRPRFHGLAQVLKDAIEDLHDYANDTPRLLNRAQCGDNDDLCNDGLCHPPGECC